MSSSNKVVEEMRGLVSAYVTCWETSQNRFVAPTPQLGITNPNLVLSNNFALCEAKYLLFIREDETNRQLVWRYKLYELPYDVVRWLPVLLTRSQGPNREF